MRNASRTAYAAASAAHTVKGLLCTLFQLAALRIRDILHNIQVLRTGLCAGIAADTAVDFRIELHHHLLVRSQLPDLIRSLVRREKRDARHIHALLYLCLTGKARLQLILSLNPVNRRTRATEAMTAAAAAL